jgi:hypothetical protein
MYLHMFVTSTLDKMKWSVLGTCRFITEKRLRDQSYRSVHRAEVPSEFFFREEVNLFPCRVAKLDTLAVEQLARSPH